MPNCVACLLLTLLSAAFSMEPPRGVSGRVIDPSGAAVVGATVSLVDLPGETVLTGGDGRFSIAAPASGAIILRVSAPGFSDARVTVAADDVGKAVDVLLQPASFFESISVTASRGAGQLTTPASATVLTSTARTTSAGGAIDDQLRDTPGFGLTRRSSSRVANPSSQGVSMRGLPGNAGSRTLVLADGLALNDLFGGWVYWNRIPDAAVERIEIVRGSAGDLYGGDAVTGVIQVFTFSPGRPRLRAAVDAASPRTARASVFGAGQAGPWVAAVAGEWVGTDGVPVVASASRGRVDVAATSNYRTGFSTVGYQGSRWQAHGRLAAYQEARGNGTPLVVNDTNWRQFSGDASGAAGGGTWTVQASGGRQHYFNNFSSVSADRSTERLTSEQRLPSTFATAAGQWVRPVKSSVVLVGAETRRAQATVEELRYSVAGTRTGPFVSGGTEHVTSVYGRAAIAASGTVTVVAGARGDFWRSTPREETAPRGAIDFFSPRLSVAWQATPDVALQASVTHAYRTPTLDELHRSSQVGNTTTAANPLLGPEQLTGIEAGALLSGSRASARVTGFWNDLTDAIVNVTLSATPSTVSQQKQNASAIRAKGAEIEAEFRPSRLLTAGGSAMLTWSRFRDQRLLPALEGHRVPQIPTYQLALGLTYADPRLATLALHVRTVGMQYEDDLNTLPLDAFTVADCSASRSLTRGLRAFLAVENIFDVEFDTGRTPVRKIGWPRTVRIGLRVDLP